MTDAESTNAARERIEPIRVQVKATWASMMLAKVVSAFRPSRLLLFAFACAAIGVAVAVETNTSFLAGCSAVLGAVTLLRLVVMAVSSALDTGVSRRVDGSLTFSEGDVALLRPDGTTASHPWTWVLEAADRAGSIVLRVDERRGNCLVFLSHAGLGAQLPRMRGLLRSKGKLR